jgi:two-component system OmpR family sensor kinase
VTRLPIRWRLTLAFSIVMALLLAATGLFVEQRLASNLDDALQRSLAGRAADVAALAQQSESGLKEAKGGTRASRADVAQLVDARGRVIDRSATAPSRPLLGADRLATVRTGTTVTQDLSGGPGLGPVRVRAEPVRAQGQQLVIIVGQSLEVRNRALSGLVSVLIVGGPIALLLAAMAGFLLTGAALRPVEAMRRRAAAISATDLEERLPSPRSHDELERLGSTLNEMLSRIQIAVARERAFVSDASHELRSPLAMLRTELELIARDQPRGAALRQAVGSAVEETDRLSRLADDLLLLARADEHTLVLRTEVIAVDVVLTAAAERARTGPGAPTITVDPSP